MSIRILLSYFCGYVNISVEGYYIEKFINMCISKGILLWNLEREKSTYLQTNISIKDFKRIKKVARKTKCKITLNKKRGFPFLLNRYKKRKIFLVSLIIISLTIFITSRFIWNIEITGNETIETAEIMEQLNGMGLKTGKYKSQIDVAEVIRKMRLYRDDIAWMSIDINGTNAIVKIVENTKKPEIIDKNDYCNIISNKAGVITKINAKNGTAQVKEGDVVKEGTLLVGGWMEGKYTGKRYVHSNAEIEARVWYSKSKEEKYIQEKNVKSGVSEERYGIKINNFKINLYKSLPKFEKYDTINKSKKIKLFSNFYLPIELEICEYQEINILKKKYTYEELKNKIIKELENELSVDVKDASKIVNKQINEKQIEGGLKIEIIYEVLENIGINQEIEENQIEELKNEIKGDNY